MVDQSPNISRHYQNWAKNSGKSWIMSKPYIEFWSDKIIRHLNLKKGDHVCDLGAGTGELARRIVDKVGSDIVCIEPTMQLMDSIRKQGLKALALSAEDFLIQAGLGSFNKIIIKQSIHHMGALPRLQLCKHFYRILNPGGRGLILTMPATVPYPMFQAAREQFARHQVNLPGLKADLQKAGFTTQEAAEEFPVDITRDEFFAAIRSRFTSNLAGFSPDEIEAGIEEIKKKYGNPERYKFGDRLQLLMFSSPL